VPKIIIRFAESAVADLEELKVWYSEQGVPETGRRFVTEIFERIETLRAHPDIGRVVPEFGQPFLRELIHPPFRIVYRRDPGKIRIVRVWRSERLLHVPKGADERE
jgi:plasmid stabilization system protein ParE